MKTIFRYAKTPALAIALLAMGAVAGLAQNPCEDAAGQNALYQKFLDQFPTKTLEGRKMWFATANEYVTKYGSCTSVEAVNTNLEYFKKNTPTWEAKIKEIGDTEKINALVARFDAGLNSKNWDEVYAAGKEILILKPDGFRPAEIVLGSIGYDEAFKGNNKYNDDTIKYAKMSIADLEANKDFKLGDKVSYGVKAFSYKDKDDALGWLNLYIGYITQVGQKNKAAAAPYLYKAAQSKSGAAKQPIPFELIGSFYFDQLNKLVEEIKVLAADQKDTDTPEVAQQKVDAIKAKVALANGTAERAMDAFARAYTLGQAPAYKAQMKKNVEDAYNVRFGKKEPVDSWIAGAVAKPFIDPTTPVTPVTDPEPAKTTSDATVKPAATTPAATAKPVSNTPATTAKPAPAVEKTTVKPAATAKPQATVKKATKKRGA